MAAQLKWDTVRTKYHLYLEELGSNVIIWILWFSRSLNVVNDNMNIGYIKAPIKGVDFFLAGPSFVVKQIAQLFLKQYVLTWLEYNLYGGGPFSPVFISASCKWQIK